MRLKTFKIHRSSVLLSVIVLLANSLAVQAKDKPWYKYENAYFEAYSDSSERKILRLLHELENFRSAIIQTTNLDLPSDAVKTQVVIFNSTKDFRVHAPTRNTAAFMIGIENIPYIVMPITGGNKWSKTVVRHEFTHVLMGYSKFRYPNWYVEGFAEFMSGTRFKKSGTTFTIGDETGRTMAPGTPISWNRLIADDFNAHSLIEAAEVNNAYQQSWMLTHYLWLGDNLSHMNELNQYLALTAAGTPSSEAFHQAFGESPNSLGTRFFRTYQRKSVFYELPFNPGVQDHDFTREPVDVSKVNEITARIQRALGPDNE